MGLFHWLGNDALPEGENLGRSSSQRAEEVSGADAAQRRCLKTASLRYKGLKARKRAMLILTLVVIAVWVFTFALCRAAGDADRYEEELERRRREDMREV